MADKLVVMFEVPANKLSLGKGKDGGEFINFDQWTMKGKATLGKKEFEVTVAAVRGTGAYRITIPTKKQAIKTESNGEVKAEIAALLK